MTEQELDKLAREALGDEFANHIMAMGKDRLREEFIALAVSCVKLKVELESLKNPRIILPK